MADQRTAPAERQQARRRVADGRIVILPPEGLRRSVERERAVTDHYALVSSTGDVRPLTAEEKRRATLAVCDHAADVVEARLFLDMLGLAGR